MNSQKKYWDQKIKEWTRASYKRNQKGLGQIGLIEKIAKFFRAGIEGRLKVTLETIGPLVKNKTVVDMGCGLGDFCFEVLKYQPFLKKSSAAR